MERLLRGAAGFVMEIKSFPSLSFFARELTIKNEYFIRTRNVLTRGTIFFLFQNDISRILFFRQSLRTSLLKIIASAEEARILYF